MFDLKAEHPHVYRHMRRLAADPAVSNGGFLGHVTLEEISGRLAE